ncbi:MAG: DUF58 domain-containing protein [Bdellovibrionales bacterium]|nr:DUF58 domain-containing protein [Bdellovibrionales bacterium]
MESTNIAREHSTGKSSNFGAAQNDLGPRVDSLREESSLHPIHLIGLVRFRGLCLLAFTLFLLSGPVPKHSDLIAAVLGFSLLSLLVVNSATTLLFGFLVRRTITIRVFHKPKKASGSLVGGDFFAHEDVTVSLAVGDGLLPPFYVLKISLIFDHPLEANVFQISGSIASQRFLLQNLRFPHRGVWNLIGYRIRLEDQLGLSRFSWDVALAPEDTSRFVCHPPAISQVDIPIMSSEMQSGDVQSEIAERKGDPFDLKRYHPSDGMKRILWKVYAKTGELISRHPERALMPEGDLLLYVVADEYDDDLAGTAIAYARQLEREQIRLWAACDGLSTAVPIANSAEKLEEYLIESVWASGHLSVAKSLAEISRLSERQTSRSASADPNRVVIFAPNKLVGNSLGSSYLLSIGQKLSQGGARPYFIITWKQAAADQTKKTELSPNAEFSPSMQSDFAAICARNGWGFILTESASARW